MPFEREWTVEERKTIWSALTALAKTARDQVWFVRWPELNTAEAAIKAIETGGKP